MEGSIQYINPEGLMKSPAFTQVVSTRGAGTTLYIGGQDAVNAERQIVGKEDLTAQTVQIMKNIQLALEACGAGFSNLVKLSIHLVQGQDASAAFQASLPFLSGMPHPPVITVVYVAGLVHPDYLLEIDATAFLPGV
jgi:enamine deaminase RidA (YjgF/YER057c/UK114 family)